MEANVTTLQAAPITANVNLNRENTTLERSPEVRPAPAVQSAPAPVASPAPTPIARPTPVSAPVISPTGVNVLNAHPTVSQSSTDDLVAPVPFDDNEISESSLAQYVNAVNQVLAPTFLRLNFSIHEATNRVSVQVIDEETDEVIREIPPESRLDLLARIQEFAGLLFDERS